MRITKLAAGAGLALTLAAFSPAVFAQSSGNYGNGQNYSNSGESYSNNGNGMESERNLRQESHEINSRIRSEEQNGTDVSAAKRQFQEGMNDWNSGNSAGAARHFERAENELGMNENTENNNRENYSENNNSEMNQGNLRSEARMIKDRIATERQNGNDVSMADHQYRLGMRDLNNGDESGARQHFQRAENDLGTNGNYGAASSSGPSSGSWSGSNSYSGENGGNGGNGWGGASGGNGGGNQ